MTTFDPKTMRRIAIMTGGGDAPGMNACVRAVVRTALNADLEVMGIQGAYAGLIRGDFIPLTARDVGGIIQRGGTFLQTDRLPQFKEDAYQEKGMQQLHDHQIDALVVIGGDGSLNGALALHRRGFPVMGVPASIDNDIWGTNMAIGVDTALNTILEAIDKLRDTASSHKRAFLIEVMGRNCGYLALMSGICGGAEVILIPEMEVSLEEVAERLIDSYQRGKTHAIIVSAEGAAHQSDDIAKYLKEKGTGFDVRVTILGHVQRGGRPSAFDRLLALRLGNAAVQCLLDGKTGMMVGLLGREVSPVPLEQVTSQPRQANLDYYDLARVLAR
jgi:6-phosphofructokinase 1